MPARRARPLRALLLLGLLVALSGCRACDDDPLLRPTVEPDDCGSYCRINLSPEGGDDRTPHVHNPRRF